MAVIDEKLKDLIDGFHEPLDDELRELRESDESEGVPLIMRETEAVLRLLLGFVKPRRVLELGTAHGYSAMFFAKMLPDAHMTTIDRNPYMIDTAKERFASYSEGSRIEFRTGEALETLESIRDEMAASDDALRYDFVFIDAAKSHYKDFLEIIEDITTDNAYIVCDNILLKGWIVEGEGKEAKRHRTNIKYMRQFLEYIKERQDLEVTILSSGDGLAIIKRK